MYRKSYKMYIQSLTLSILLKKCKECLGHLNYTWITLVPIEGSTKMSKQALVYSMSLEIFPFILNGYK